MTRTTIKGLLVSSFTVLTFVSLLVFSGDADQPWVHFRVSDALIQIGLASILVVLWILFAATLCFLILRGQISALWCWLVIWAALAILVLALCPFDYVDEITRSMVEKP